MAVAVSNSLSELDAMLHEMSSAKYGGRSPRNNLQTDDYSSDYGGTMASMMSDAPQRPPLPKSYGAPEKRSRAKLKSGDSNSLKLPPTIKPPKLQVRFPDM